MKELIVASTNQGKIKEIRAMLKDIDIEVLAMNDVLDDDIEISLPIEEYLSGDKVEKVKQEDGTYSILLKDVSEVIVK